MMYIVQKVVLVCFLFFAITFTGGQAAADTVVNGCMQDMAGFELNCKANDVQISGVARNDDGTPQLTILDDGCAFLGDTVTFEATFEVVVTASERHDIGIYFVTDGDPNGDGAISGQCIISNLPYQPDPPWLDLDGTSDTLPGTNVISGVQDTCGDINKTSHNPLFPRITLTAKCIDYDNDTYLNLPNCTSWRQSGANDLCTSPDQTFPGAPSKCRCDVGFNVPIEVPPAELRVVKTAIPDNIDEPGGAVTFTVTVTNIGIDPNNPVTLDELTDNIYGDISVAGHDNILSTTCSVPQTIPVDDQNPGGIDTYECQFTADVSGNANDQETDTVTASGTDARDNPISGYDDATVTINDVLPTITLTKTVDQPEVLEPGGDVNFTVVVTNNSVISDPVTIDDLSDSIYGNLNGQGNCAVPQTIQAGSNYTCSFSAFVGLNAGDSETDLVTASGSDDEGNPVSASDSATVNVNDVPSAIELIKTANPGSVDEPGGDVTFTFSISNTSAVDTVTIDSLTDSIYGDLDGRGDCAVPQTIGAGGNYTCSFSVFIGGDANTSETNVASASGLDDDGNPVSDNDDATVIVRNVQPAATLTKSPTMAVVTFEVVVTNDSTAEALELTELIDDVYGDITSDVTDDILGTTCNVPQTIEVGSSYTCSFDARVSTSPHTDTVTGTVSDDDGSSVLTASDSATVTLE
jgi:hypothetical protein